MLSYGDVAVRATDLVLTHSCKTVADAWDEAANAVFPHSTSLQEKGCPRSVYLGLCEEGLVEGIPAGSYTRSRGNKGYALQAVQLLQQNPDLANANPDVLWDRVMDGKEKTSNSQMDVVLALWRKGLIRRSGTMTAKADDA